MTIEQQKQSTARLLASARRDPHAFVREARRSTPTDSPVTIDWQAAYDPAGNAVELGYTVNVTAPDTYFTIVVPVFEDPSTNDAFAGAFHCINPNVTTVSGVLNAYEWAPNYAGRSVLVGVFGYVDQGGKSQVFQFSQIIPT
jgi:hypothetical protein